MGSQLMPEAVTAANIYLQDGELYGVSDVQLPPFEALTNTIKGGGIAGEIEIAVKGIFGSMVLALNNWITVSDNFALIMEPKTHEIQVYASLQEKNVVSGEITDIQLYVFVKGRPKTIDPGKLVTGESAEGAIEIEIDYIKIDRDGKEVVELDKYNWVYRVNGTDYLEKVRANLGKA